ncbi:MAG: sulfite exporter TauE/SafE family protein [Flavobacteriaceae bacterium]|jgi:sulfite exporter TauE/SafE|nr:sulfite exporter TauE/SafE family protein [Flavobacteriaceae bacterium]
MELGTIYLAALSIGLVFGFHCVGMCGPIAFSLGLDADNKFKFYTQNFLYQFGRITTYALLGAAVGVVGQGFDIAGYQRYVSIIAGILLIAMVLLPGKSTEIGTNLRPVNRFMIKIKIFLSKYLQRKDNVSRYITGILNGFLPCGIVYFALASSLVAGGVVQGALYMAFFGLGTFPFMFVTTLAGKLVNIKIRKKVMKLFPYFMIVLGVLFILRGTGLGIKMLSPSKEALEMKKEEKVPECCK